MRCDCCNNILTPSESTRKFKKSGNYTDTCNTCLNTIADDLNEFTETVDGGGVDTMEDEDDVPEI